MWLGALLLLLLLWFLAPFVLNGFRYPLGPDGPVYLWWSRLAGHDGLSAVARPGVPAVALTLAGALHLPLTAVVAALEVALGVALGLGAWALARAAGAVRWVAFVAGLLAGTFAVHLASGYLATLAFAVGFVAAIVALAGGGSDRSSTVAAAVALAGATLSHPLFGPLGAAILVGAAVLGREDRPAIARIGGAVLGAAMLAGAGILALTSGPGPVDAVTSRDGYLRRASGLGSALREAYLDRFVHRWTRYVQWLSVPLALAGWVRPSGIVRRILWSWTVATAAGVVFAVATSLLPPDRFITFGFAIPILAAFGLDRVASFVRARRPAFAAPVVAVVVVAMLAGAGIAWLRQTPFIDDLEVRQLALADGVAATAPPGATLFFLVDEPDDTVSFLAAHAANVVRAVVAPERIRDAIVVVPRTTDPAPERAAVEEQTNADLRQALLAGRVTVGFSLSAFAPTAGGGIVPGSPWRRAGPGVETTAQVSGRVMPSDAALEPTSTVAIAIGSVLALALLTVAGLGWLGLASFGRGPTTMALAPAFGSAVLVLVAIALERLGVPLTGAIGPTAVSAVAVAGGFALRFVLERRRRPDALP